MNRPKIVRLELLLLAAVLLLLAYRVMEGPPAPEGLVVHSDIAPEELLRHSVSAARQTRVTVDAVGSFESDGPSAPLAAYGWLLRRGDRRIVWRMDPAAVVRERGTIALAGDTVDLTPGTYDVYYTSYGNRSDGRFGISFLDRLLGEERAWRGDADRWQMTVRNVDGDDALERLTSQSTEALSPGGPGLLWSTAPMDGRRAEEYVFQASRPIQLRIYAVGEIDRDQMDYGWIDDAVTGERVWEMTRANTEPAGGWDVNRIFEGTIELKAGIYRAAFETDPRQHYGDWVGNPPYDPAAWGITLYGDAEDAITRFDPWTTHTPIVQIDRVGDDERRSVQFRVNQPIQIAVYGLGELGDSGRYDYGWIRDNESQTTVWEMTEANSRPAGGHYNRYELAFLTLDPSTYTVTYETDDSHSYDSWRHGRPDNPERWGLTIFPVAVELDSTAVEILESTQEDLGEQVHAQAPHPSLPPGGGLPSLPGETIVDLTRLDNERRVSKSFTIEEPQTLRLRALGEISLSAPYDYGWIEDAETGEIVWQMTWQNTAPAGGDDSYRMFDGTLSLGPGEYVAHFKTDFSRAYGDFGGQAPRYPEAWGIQVVKPVRPPQ